MKLVQQIINYKLGLFQEHLLNNRHSKGIWDFYMAYNMAKAMIKFQDVNKNKKNYLWKNFLTQKSSTQYYKALTPIVQEDIKTIIDALKSLNIAIREQSFEGSNLETADSIGVLAYEYDFGDE